MVLLKARLPKKLWKVLEFTTTQLMMIAVVGPFFFIFFYMFWNSLKPDYLFFEPGTWIFEPMWSNYTDVLENSDLFPNILNSLIISGSATLIGLFCGLLTSYTVTRFNMRKLVVGILLTRMIPYITALVPLDRVQAPRFIEYACRHYSGPLSDYYPVRGLDYVGLY